MDDELWEEIPSTNGIYFISINGNVKSIDHYVNINEKSKRIQHGRILKTHKSKKGYVMCYIKKNGIRFHTSIHRLLAQAFIPNPNNKEQVNHINGIKDDNRIENLRFLCPNCHAQTPTWGNK